ncbi:hypothetical protein [Streptomyces tagetis]|uniref:Uncharacterized protein n=1 Tax=Streptomyces tagetis TaxID=2820809 RepID=A0A940XMS2_9ACTN|nr:hypothetical protein [Streptomyces sp. RG38]MBQ0827429.1 hypothetical protein [Streptomyces sp. RG38]
MHQPMRHALERVLALLFSLLLPATGRRRGAQGTASVPVPPRTLSGLRLLIHRTGVAGLCAPVQEPGPLVRPYLLAYERAHLVNGPAGVAY